MDNIPTGYIPRTDTPEALATAAKTRAKAISDMIEQPDPKPNQNPAVWPLVMVDMASRDKLGRDRYGTPLQAHNGRDALRDAYEEALDLAVYLRTAIFERDGA